MQPYLQVRPIPLNVKYHVWVSRVKTVLEGNCAWHLVDLPVAEPPAAADSDEDSAAAQTAAAADGNMINAEKLKEAWVMAFLLECVEQVPVPGKDDAETPRELWRAIETYCRRVEQYTQDDPDDALSDSTMRADESLVMFFDRRVGDFERYERATGERIPDKFKQKQIVDSAKAGKPSASARIEQFLEDARVTKRQVVLDEIRSLFAGIDKQLARGTALPPSDTVAFAATEANNTLTSTLAALTAQLAELRVEMAELRASRAGASSGREQDEEG